LVELAPLRCWTGAFVDEPIAIVVEAVANLWPAKRLDIRHTAQCPVLALQDALGADPLEPGRAWCAPAGIAFVSNAVTVVVQPVAPFE
jgi:hypothetical protein